ncbi:hypothetical protein BH10PLA2_BH10PLA2_09880 [soil metagenome]
MTMRSQQGLVDIPPPQPRNMDRTPTAETHWFQLQAKGIFTGAHLSICAQKDLRVGTRHHRIGSLVKRIGGDASTVQEKERKYCHQQ